MMKQAKVVRGIPNIGCSCFANSIMQILAVALYLPGLRGTLGKLIADLFNDGNRDYEKARIMQRIYKHLHMRHEFGDASEFVENILNVFSKKEPDLIEKIGFVNYHRTSKCRTPGCQYETSRSYSTFPVISMTDGNLPKYYRNVIKKGKVSGGNCILCGNSVDSFYNFDQHKLEKFIVTFKDSSDVNCPENLDSFNLQAVSLTSHGHYIAAIKVEENHFVICDDGSVSCFRGTLEDLLRKKSYFEIKVALFGKSTYVDWKCPDSHRKPNTILGVSLPNNNNLLLPNTNNVEDLTCLKKFIRKAILTDSKKITKVDEKLVDNNFKKLISKGSSSFKCREGNLHISFDFCKEYCPELGVILTLTNKSGVDIEDFCLSFTFQSIRFVPFRNATICSGRTQKYYQFLTEDGCSSNFGISFKSNKFAEKHGMFSV